MRRAVPLDLAPKPIADAIQYWRNTGVYAGDVWESVTGHRRHHVTWPQLAALLMAEAIGMKEAV